MQARAGTISEVTLGVVETRRNEGERLVACLDSLEPVGTPVVYVGVGAKTHRLSGIAAASIMPE